MDKKKKGILIAFACMLVFAVVGSIFTFGDFDLASLLEREEEETAPTAFYFHPPAYGADILSDEAYRNTDRAIRLTDGGVTTILEEPYTQYSEAISCLATYLQAAVMGDNETLNACFTKAYVDKNGEKGRFPMQRLYDIVIEKIGEYALTEGEYAGMTRFVFHVSYKIQKNDGLFDSGIPSDGYKVRVFELLGGINGTQINSIGEYRMG